ncbi:hypothetical protein [Streptomyces hydrogenans]|uniref:hypothetical protein n=1 Tax=Streptomyces hydrogenans TaxID=1873719 RepID=UPI00381043F3
MSARYELLHFIGSDDDETGAMVNAHRAEVIAERDAQIVAWLAKKAAEYGTSNRENRAKSWAVSCMADKLSRGAVRDDETGVSELYRLRAENNQLRAQVAEVCGQRDAWHDWADTLAYKVAPVEVLGRHGEEGKFPWDDALKLITPAAEVAALRARVAELEAAAICSSVARLHGSKCVLPVRHRGDHQDETKRHYWSDDYAVPQQRQAEDPHDNPRPSVPQQRGEVR